VFSSNLNANVEEVSFLPPYTDEETRFRENRQIAEGQTDSFLELPAKGFGACGNLVSNGSPQEVSLF
jgi:hypothetical protein